MTTASAPTQTADTGERADLLEILRTRRHFLRYATDGLTDGQAAAAPTVSELCIGGLVKHVSKVESAWVDFLLGNGSSLTAEKSWDEWGPEDWAARAAEFQLLPGETLAGILDEYEQVAARTDEQVVEVPDLNATQLLPTAPWFEPGSVRSARQVLLHIAAETAQHAGHADIIRETIDGQKSMG